MTTMTFIMCPSSWNITAVPRQQLCIEFVFLILHLLFSIFGDFMKVSGFNNIQLSVNTRPLALTGCKHSPLILKGWTGKLPYEFNLTWRHGTRFFWQRKWGLATFFLREVRGWKFSPSFFSTVGPSCALTMREKMTDCLPDGILLQSTMFCSSPTSFWATLDASRHVSVMRSPTCWLVVVLRWVPIRDNGERE